MMSAWTRALWRGALLSGMLLAPNVLAAEDKPAPAERRAETSYLSSDYARAARELEASKATSPSARLLRARLEHERGAYESALSLARDVRESAYAARAAVVGARALHEMGRTDEAVAWLRRAVSEKGKHGRAARVMLGELLLAQGQRARAEPILMSLADDYNQDAVDTRDAEDLLHVGRALHLARKYKSANRALGEGHAVDKSNVFALLARAELFLEKYDTGQAASLLEEALRIGPNRPDALVLLARAKLQDSYDFAEARRLSQKALSVNPKHAGAHAILAGLALRTMSIGEADRLLDAGLAHSPRNLELLSLRAATRFLDDDKPGYARAKAEVLARNPEFSGLYQVVGEYAEWEHRYDDVVVMMREATKLDPRDGRAWGQLGLTELRNGDETSGLQSLKEAFRLDPYNVRVYNTLEHLYEKWIPARYETVSTGPFLIRYPKAERAVLERYLPAHLSHAWASLAARYGFVPVVPLSVELYEKREHFSVRTSGLPNIGIHGVCFGKTMASMSPASEPFNWGNVVWHELAHVFAIQLSKNHVPRWFTEGLSEYETLVRRPEWRRGHDAALYQALVDNKLPSLADMTQAFTHGKDGLDVVVAYYAAGQVIVYLAEKFGFEAITQALKLWGTGLSTPKVLQGAFGVPVAELDQGFRTWALGRLAHFRGQYVPPLERVPLATAQSAVQKSPKDAKLHAILALAYLRARKPDEATRSLTEALRLDAKNLDALYVSSVVASANRDAGGARARLEELVERGGDGYHVRMELAEHRLEAADTRAAVEALERAARFDPSQAEPLHKLLAITKKDQPSASPLPILRRLAMLEQHDRKVWRAYVEQLLLEKRFVEAESAAKGALFLDLYSAELHQLYARALLANNQDARARFELESALLCGPDVTRRREILGDLVAVNGRLGDREGAARASAELRAMEDSK